MKAFNKESMAKPEIILTMPQDIFGGLGGINEPNIRELEYNQMWMRRDLANANTDDVRQLASYALITRIVDGERQYLVYSRTGGDAKLQGKWSIGWGGHPELGDVMMASEMAQGEAISILDIMRAGAMREIREEVHMDVENSENKEAMFNGPVNMIIMQTGGIEDYHAGFVYVMEIGSDIECTSKDPENDAVIGWYTAEQLHGLEEGKLENWSVRVKDNLDHLNAVIEASAANHKATQAESEGVVEAVQDVTPAES